MSEGLVAVYVPSLITLLAAAEGSKGSSLTRDEVTDIRDRGVCIMLTQAEARKIAEAQGYTDINPDHVWDQWQEIRAKLPPDQPKPAHARQGRVRYLFANSSPEDLPNDEKERHEAFIEIFGRQLFSVRNEALERIRALVEAPQKVRDDMGSIYSKEYTAVAQLPPEVQSAALNLSRKAVDTFLRDLLLILAHNGLCMDLAFGSEHAFAFKLVLQVIEKQRMKVLEQQTVNEGGEKVFYEYYGRWLNNHRDA